MENILTSAAGAVMLPVCWEGFQHSSILVALMQSHHCTSVSTKACRLVNNVVSLISECSPVNDFNLFSVFCYVDPPLSHSDTDTR